MKLTPEVEKHFQELNDLVRGAVEGSKKAVDELRGEVEKHDEALSAVDQVRKDVEALGLDLRKFTKQRLAGLGRDADYGGGFASRTQAREFGLKVMAEVCGIKWAGKKLADEGIEVKAMTEADDAAGGFTLNPEEMGSLIRLVESYGVFRRNARMIPMGTDRSVWPKRTGGLTVYCPGEGQTITPSDITLAQIALTAKKWCTLTAISTELEEDSAVALAELIAQEIALAFSIQEDQCGFNGDGTSTYFGITGVLGHGSTTNQAAATADDTFAEACAWKYLTGAIGQVPTWAMPTARYYFHRSVFWQHVVGQIDSNGQPIVKFGPAAGQPGGAPLQLGAATPMLMGFPVELSEVLPTTADDAASTAFWCFGSLQMGWYFGQRGRPDVAQSREVYFASDQVAVRGRQRVDVQAADATSMVKTTTGSG